jgi:hypothetical protein
MSVSQNSGLDFPQPVIQMAVSNSAPIEKKQWSFIFYTSPAQEMIDVV